MTYADPVKKIIIDPLNRLQAWKLWASLKDRSIPKIHFRNKGFDQDQTQHIVGPGLGSNCLQLSSANDKSCFVFV